MTRRSDLDELTEGAVVDGVQLSRDEAVALNATKLVSVQPAADGWTVTAAYAVGALRCADLTVRVQPKVGTVQTLRLLARAHGLRDLKLDDLPVEVADDVDLTTALAVLFASEATRAMASGPLRGYRTEDQTLATLRGWLRVREQELRRFGQLVPIEVTVDEWTSDIPENRRLRAATRRLLALPGVTQLERARLVRLDRQLAEVRLVPPGSLLESWTPNRLNARLHSLLELADLVLANQTVEHRVGTTTVTGFVISMPLLFERLVTRLIRDAATLVTIDAQRQFHLDHGGAVTIKPDLVLVRDRQVVGVADMKYKLLDETGKFPNADAYQLLAYCTRLGLDQGHLIYAAGEPRPDPIQVRGSSVEIHTHSLSLNAPISDLELAAAELLGDLLGQRPNAAHQVASVML